VSAPKKYNEEFRDRAVRMYRDRLAEPGESKLGARRHAGSLFDINQATLRNWIEERYATDGAKVGSGRSTEFDEIRALKKRVAELERAHEILKTSAGSFAQAELDRRLK
jgi:transposase